MCEREKENGEERGDQTRNSLSHQLPWKERAKGRCVQVPSVARAAMGKSARLRCLLFINITSSLIYVDALLIHIASSFIVAATPVFINTFAYIYVSASTLGMPNNTTTLLAHRLALCRVLSVPRVPVRLSSDHSHPTRHATSRGDRKAQAEWTLVWNMRRDRER